MQKSRICFLLLLLLCIYPLSGFGQGQYKKLLKNQGFTQMKTPRTSFGTGTIIGRLGDLEDEPLATPDQCFPGLSEFVTTQEIKLIDTHQEKKLGISAGANFVPGGGSILGSIIGAFNFNRVKNLDVTFGKTTGYDWTLVAFEDYLAGKPISRTCYKRLTDPKNKIILSTAKVESLTYTFNGELKAGVEVNAALLESTLKANFGFSYSNLTRNSFTVSSPMFIAYKAIKFSDAGLDIMEDADSPVTLEKGKFKIVSAKAR